MDTSYWFFCLTVASIYLFVEKLTQIVQLLFVVASPKLSRRSFKSGSSSRRRSQSHQQYLTPRTQIFNSISIIPRSRSRSKSVSTLNNSLLCKPDNFYFYIPFPPPTPTNPEKSPLSDIALDLYPRQQEINVEVHSEDSLHSKSSPQSSSADETTGLINSARRGSASSSSRRGSLPWTIPYSDFVFIWKKNFTFLPFSSFRHLSSPSVVSELLIQPTMKNENRP